jgi:uncharacterized protein (DUF1501 family)
MNRRKFLTNSALFSVPIMLKGMPVFAGEGVLNPMLQKLAMSAANCGKVLVIVQMNGGNDGINMVIPLNQYTNLAVARPGVLIPETSVLPLAGISGVGLHPSMTGLRDLYNNGKVAIVQGVSYPNPNYSHFFAQDIWFSGTTTTPVGGSEVTAGTTSSGWLGRNFDINHPTYPTGYPNAVNNGPMAIQVGGSLPFSLRGNDDYYGYNAPNPASLVSVATTVPEPAPLNDYGTEITFLRQMRNQSNAFAANITAAWTAGGVTTSTMYPASSSGPLYNGLAEQLKVVARLIGGGLSTPVYIVNQPEGYDTHDAQVNTSNYIDPTQGHARNLFRLSQAISAFQNDITIRGKADIVTGMTYSEFGRRVISNANNGTDHGVGAPIIFFGNKVNPGVLGTNPIVPAVSNGNTQVAMQHDFRQLYSTVMQQWMCMTGAEATTILNGTFSVIPIFNASVLPLTGMELRAKWDNEYASLNFDVLENTSYDRFIVERSVDGITFSLVDTIVNTSLNNNESYSYRDKRINASVVYYRIKGISKQNEISYSKIAVLKNEKKQDVRVFPNPVTNHTINIEFFNSVNEQVQIIIYGTLGQKIYSNQINPRGNKIVTFIVPHSFDVETIYILNITYGANVINEKILFA